MAAQQLGEAEARRVCEENLREEEAMAALLEENMTPLPRSSCSGRHLVGRGKKVVYERENASTDSSGVR